MIYFYDLEIIYYFEQFTPGMWTTSDMFWAKTYRNLLPPANEVAGR